MPLLQPPFESRILSRPTCGLPALMRTAWFLLHLSVCPKHPRDSSKVPASRLSARCIRRPCASSFSIDCVPSSLPAPQKFDRPARFLVPFLLLSVFLYPLIQFFLSFSLTSSALCFSFFPALVYSSDVRSSGLWTW